MQRKSTASEPGRILVVGGGFGGLACARRLATYGYDVRLIDRRRDYLFQPLLYQVATGALAPSVARTPLCGELPDSVHFVCKTVLSIQPEQRRVQLSNDTLDYDILVLAPGAQMAMPREFPEARPLKNLDDAVTMREQLCDDLTNALDEGHAAANTIVVGGGPTGVELAGEIQCLAEKQLARSSINPRVILVEQSDKLLPGFSRRSSIAAKAILERLGVSVRLESKLTKLGPHHYAIHGTSGTFDLEAHTLVWAAGVRPSPLLEGLGTTDQSGRIFTDSYCRLPDHPNIFVIGDSARYEGNDEVLPSVAAVAIQQGHYVADHIAHPSRRPFRYFNPGRLAHVGGRSAVGEIFGVPVRGFVPFVLAELVHLAYLPRLDHRLLALRDFVATQVGRRNHLSSRSKPLKTHLDPIPTSQPLPPTLH